MRPQVIRAVSKNRLRHVVVLTLGAAAFTASVPAQQGAPRQPRALRRIALAQHRSASREPHARGGRTSRASRTPSTWRRSTAASGRRPTRAHVDADLRRSADRVDRHDRRRAVGRRTSSTSAAAKGCTGPISRRATASTSRPTPGRTWTHLGLRDAQQIPNIAVDPRESRTGCSSPRSDIRTVPNEERGIYRSTDGGTTFQKVLSKDENTGGNDVDIDPSNPDIVYATMWEERQGPWENAVWAGTNGGIFKSTDGGTTWKPLTNGLPSRRPGERRDLAGKSASGCSRPSPATTSRAPSSDRGAAGIYRSDDAGETWTRITDRHASGGPHRRRRPADADPASEGSGHRDHGQHRVVEVDRRRRRPGRRSRAHRAARTTRTAGSTPTTPTSSCSPPIRAPSSRSTAARRGAPGTTSRPAQFYHVAADNAFPYRVCSGQQESGSVCVASRGNYGAISDRDWLPVGVDEYGYVAPDPLESRHRLRRPHA